MDQAVKYSVQEMIKIVEAYFATKSVVQTPQFRSRDFPGRNGSTRRTKTRLLDKFRVTVIVRYRITLKIAVAEPVSQARKWNLDCERMFEAVSKEIHKTFVPGDTSFKEFSYADNALGSSLVFV